MRWADWCAQFAENGLGGRRDGAAGKADAHVIVNARLTRRVDLAVGELGNKDARLDAGAAAYAGSIAGIEKLLHRVKHVEVHNAQQLDAALAGQPCQTGRRIAVGIEREKRMAVQIGHLGRRGGLRIAFQQLRQRCVALVAIKAVERLFQVKISCLLRHHKFAPVLGRSESVSKAVSHFSTGRGYLQAKTNSMPNFRKRLQTILEDFLVNGCESVTLIWQ